MNQKNYSGKQFGELTLLYQDIERSKKTTHAYWFCQCSCGTICDIRLTELTKKNKTHCGCKNQKNANIYYKSIDDYSAILQQQILKLPQSKQNEIYSLQFIPVGRASDLTGQVFGNWTVLGRGYKEDKAAYWYCLCNCKDATIKLICSSHLIYKQSMSCGCLQKQIVSSVGKQNILNEVGNIYGNLTVIRDSGKRKNRAIIWECQCQCGQITYADGWSLRNGRRVSCGCLKSSGEKKIKSLLTENNILFKTEYSCEKLQTNKHGYLRFDFAIFNDKKQLIKLIEFDGSQHYYDNEWFNDSLEDIQKRDQLKNAFCKEENIPLLRIPYWDYDKIDITYLLERKTFI